LGRDDGFGQRGFLVRQAQIAEILEVEVGKDKKTDDLREESAFVEEDMLSSEDSPGKMQDESQSLEKELAGAQEENAQLRDKVLRMAAEFDNYKKRMERERLLALKYSGELIFREILPVIDNLERAIGRGVVDGATTENNLNALLEGVQLTFKSLISTLEKFEVKVIDSIGQPFNPNQHEALTMEPSEIVAASHVLKEFEKGYYYKDRLLRAAKVIVSSGRTEKNG
jgi:molecular chaperone GrpE